MQDSLTTIKEDQLTDQPSTAGTEKDTDVTPETISALATKLDSFGGALDDRELVVLATVLHAGMQALSSEVKGFSREFIDIESWSFGATSPLGTIVRRYDIVGAFPKKLEIGQVKSGDGG